MDATATLIGRNQDLRGRLDEGGPAAPPALKVAIVTCMDARLHPAQAFGLELGDAHVIRNAGGAVTDEHQGDCPVRRADAPERRDHRLECRGDDVNRGELYVGFHCEVRAPLRHRAPCELASIR